MNIADATNNTLKKYMEEMSTSMKLDFPTRVEIMVRDPDVVIAATGCTLKELIEWASSIITVRVVHSSVFEE